MESWLRAKWTFHLAYALTGAQQINRRLFPAKKT
jgi:hypothetical protein